MMVVVCTKCRCSNQFGTLFCRNCGEKLKIVDQNHPDFSTGKTIKKIILKTINLVIVLGLIVLLGALFIPLGLPVEDEMTDADITKARQDCESIDNALKTGKGTAIFTFTPARASWGMNYLLDEKRPMPPMPTVASVPSYASPSVSTPPAGITPSAPMQSRSSGPIKFGSGGLSSGGRSLPSAPPPPTPARQPQMVQAVEATPEAGVWKGHTSPNQKKAEETAKEEPIFTAKYAVKINNNRNTSVILAGKMLYYLPYRLELIGELKDSEPDANGNTKPEFELKSARFGHVPLPSILKKHSLELFKLMTSDKKIKAYAERIKTIKVESEDAIQVTVNR